MKKLALFLATFFALMMPFASIAQIYDPVQWSFSTESLGNNEYNVIFKADIESGWHVYSQNIHTCPVHIFRALPGDGTTRLFRRFQQF